MSTPSLTTSIFNYAYSEQFISTFATNKVCQRIVQILSFLAQHSNVLYNLILNDR